MTAMTSPAFSTCDFCDAHKNDASGEFRVQAAPVGIRALGLVPMPTERRGEGQRDVVVCIHGEWVRPGDWLYADADGIVVSSHSLT